MKVHYHIVVIMLFAGALPAEPLLAEPLPTAFKPVPTRPAVEANVVVEDQEILDECKPEKICVQGRLFNNGAKPAYRVKLRVEIGGAKQGRPRHTIAKKPDNQTMEPGDRQEYYLELDRKIPVKNKKGEEKILEVGKYNFKVVPAWTANKPRPPAAKKRKR